jgi:hypothetical protein
MLLWQEFNASIAVDGMIDVTVLVETESLQRNAGTTLVIDTLCGTLNCYDLQTLFLIE